MISMPMIGSIRDMSRRGLANADIQRETGISQPTMRKYLAMDDFSPKMPTASGRGSMLDPCKPSVDVYGTVEVDTVACRIPALWQ